LHIINWLSGNKRYWLEKLAGKKVIYFVLTPLGLAGGGC
jgi:hypothetical protein